MQNQTSDLPALLSYSGHPQSVESRPVADVRKTVEIDIPALSEMTRKYALEALCGASGVYYGAFSVEWKEQAAIRSAEF